VARRYTGKSGLFQYRRSDNKESDFFLLDWEALRVSNKPVKRTYKELSKA